MSKGAPGWTALCVGFWSVPAKVTQLEDMLSRVYQEVLWLNVSMAHPQAVGECQGAAQLIQVELQEQEVGRTFGEHHHEMGGFLCFTPLP